MFYLSQLSLNFNLTLLPQKINSGVILYLDAVMELIKPLDL